MAIVMVTGGSRSGKSRFAEDFCQSRSEKLGYIATAQIYDNEMKERIERHRSRRGENWTTFEIPCDIESALDELSDYDYVLLDCLTMLIFNKMYVLSNQPENLNREERNEMEHRCLDFLEKIFAALCKSKNTYVIVTNEIGMGIVPESSLSRLYRDIVGKANQMLAESATEVYFVISGIPMKIK